MHYCSPRAAEMSPQAWARGTVSPHHPAKPAHRRPTVAYPRATVAALPAAGRQGARRRALMPAANYRRSLPTTAAVSAPSAAVSGTAPSRERQRHSVHPAPPIWAPALIAASCATRRLRMGLAVRSPIRRGLWVASTGSTSTSSAVAPRVPNDRPRWPSRATRRHPPPTRLRGYVGRERPHGWRI